jgi:4-amino-4-deoxy-L-arabinose transferase-like glycosyltransferase
VITRRQGWQLLLGMLVCWAIAQAVLLPPTAVAGHWRQAETQSMALNLAHRGFEPLMPRINWGGDGPGYVEAELPLYQSFVAPLLLLDTDAEWPGMAVSISCIALAAMVFYAMAERRFGAAAALVGAMYVPTSRLGVHLSTAVMPDAMMALLYLVALERFLVWLEDRRLGPLFASAVALGLAGCIKPTALGLGIAEFGIVVWSARDALRRPALWGAWLLTLVLTGVWLWHGTRIYAQYGNSFGVVSGTDSKFPALGDLLSKAHLYNLTRVSLEWGIGRVPLLLAVVLLVRRRWQATEWSLAVANVVVLFVSLRYAVLDYAGGHYHVFAMLFAAWLVAQGFAMMREDLRPRPRLVLLLAVSTVGLLLAQYVDGVIKRRHEDRAQAGSSIVALGRTLAEHVAPDMLVVVQSDDDAWDPEWQRRDNYQDPRLFYASGTRGWVLARDGAKPELLADYAARGAALYVVCGPTPETLVGWLGEHARVVHHDEHGTIYALGERPSA